MTTLLLDTSVLVKWFHSDGESELGPARAIRSAHVAGDVDVCVLDLATYELGDVLTRGLHWPSLQVVEQLNDLHTLVGPALSMPSAGWRTAARLAEQHSLTFYDACWAAAAAELAAPLITADRQLLASGLGESPTQLAERLRLR